MLVLNSLFQKIYKLLNFQYYCQVFQDMGERILCSELKKVGMYDVLCS